jgi:Rrf2 family protein
MRLELTHRGSYAIRAVLTLARAEKDEVVPARHIAKEMDIPVRFLPQVLGDLNRAGIVEARLGRAGGYRLSKPATDISLLDIIEAAEGDARRQTCVLSGKPCDGHDPCDVHDMFFEAQEAILQRLDGVSVADVVADSRRSPVPIEGTASTT